VLELSGIAPVREDSNVIELEKSDFKSRGGVEGHIPAPRAALSRIRGENPPWVGFRRPDEQ